MKVSVILQKSCVFLLLAVLLWLLCVIFRPFEPRYQGKRLSLWMNDLSNWEGPDEYKQATNAVRHIGIRVLPYALELCRTKVSGETRKGRFEEWLNKRKLIGVEIGELYQMHPAGEVNPHWESQELFRILGPSGKPAIPSLIKLLCDNDRDVAETAACDLAYIGPDAIPPLIGALANQNAQVREFSAHALGWLGESFRKITEVKGPNSGVRYAIGAVEERFKPQIQLVLPALLQCLKDEDRRVRSAAAFALGSIREDAPAVVPALITALETETNPALETETSHTASDFLESGIFIALGHYGTNASPAVPLLVKFLKSHEINSWRRALHALNKIDPETAKTFMEQWKTHVTELRHLPDPPSKQLQRPLQSLETNSLSTNAPLERPPPFSQEIENN